MDELDALSKGKVLVDEALGHSKATSPQSQADLNRNANTERVAQERQEPVFVNELMTRRDFFAIGALQAILTNKGEHLEVDDAACIAFVYADAMVKARESKR